MIEACVLKLREEGVLDEARAALFSETYRELADNLKASMAAGAAEAAASDEAMAAAAAALLRKKRLAGLRHANRSGIVEALKGATENGVDLDVAVKGLFSHDERMPGVSTLEGRYGAVRGKAHSMLTDLLETFDRKLFGTIRNPAQMLDVVREAFGQETGTPAARELAAAWMQTAEYLRQRFNAAGGMIGRIEHWGMPQVHDALRIKAAGFAEWKAFVLPRLDLTRMLDAATNRPLSGARLHKALRGVYDGITTAGWDDRSLAARGRGQLAGQRAEERFLIFKDADNWLDYQQQFGGGDARGEPTALFDAMMGHVDEMARDIAAMEILGPDPTATRTWLKNMLVKAANRDALPDGAIRDASSRARSAGEAIDNMWGVFSGEVNRPVNATVARWFSATRHWMSAAKLGGAFISSLSDLMAGASTRHFNGLPAAKVIGDQVKWMLPRVKDAERGIAIRSGLISDEAGARLGRLWRDTDDFSAPAWATRMSGALMRGSLLSRWTQVGKWAFGMEFMGHMADVAGSRFAELPAPTRAAFERYGIDAADWDKIRATPTRAQEGAHFLRPDEVRTASHLSPADAERISDRMLELLQTEGRFAVPEPNLRNRAAMTQGARPGTFLGEVMRTGLQFKGFGVSVLMQHSNRAMHGVGGTGRAAYAASFVIGSTLLGALAMQVKSVLAGRDPRPMTDPAFWGAAMAQGGGLGIAGDFLFADTNRFGGSLMASALGPTAGAIEDIARLTHGNIAKSITGEDTNAGRELVRFLRLNTPGSSLWYGRLAFDRLIWGQLQEMADPEFAEGNRRLIRRAETQYGAPYWWQPGETTPDRAPNLSNAFEGPPQ